VRDYPPEAIARSRHRGSSLPAQQARLVRERLRSNTQRLTEPQERSAGVAPRSACAFLLDGQCSAYAVRPAACAGYHSLSREACERDHQGAGSTAPSMNAGSGGIPMSQAMQHVGTAMSEGLAIGLNTLGLSSSQVELQTAVAALLAEPALIGRWRAGREWPRDATGLVHTKK
jgi:hypothetical protein